MKPIHFRLPFEDHLLDGDTTADTCQTIILHGAGQSDRARFERLRKGLHASGIPSAGFDFIGHGRTGGSLTGSCLRSRTAQAEAVIRHVCSEPLTIIGVSMGGYTAVKLVQCVAVQNLVLLVPAVYTPRAYALPFGPEFSAAIRKPGSWQDSDAFDILERFTGNLLIIAAEADHVIPTAVIDRLYASAGNAGKRRVHVVPGSKHSPLFPTQTEFQRALEIIRPFCR